MTNWRKIILLFALSAFFAEGKVKSNERIVPIEVVLNTKNNVKETVIPESNLIKNKAIELKIRSNENEEGKVDLIIAATKEVQATERKIDRYSPAFNAEHGFLNNETPKDSNIVSPLGRNWDTSRQDSPAFPSNSADLFPFLLLRHVLQTPQPFFLEQNQFSPLQNLRHFEDNLQRQLIPHTNQGIGTANGLPMGVVVSQPIFTGDSRNILDQQRLLNSPQVLNLMQHGLLQIVPQNNQNIPHISDHLSALHNPPLNRYSIINGTPLNLQSPQNQNFLQNNAISGNFHGPNQQYSEHRNIEPSLRQQPLVPQSIPDILGPNKQPLPIHKRPEYTLGRNLQNVKIDKPLYKNTPPQTILPHRDLNQNLPKLSDFRIRKYQQNDSPQASPYQTAVRDNQNLYPQQHRSLSPIQSTLKDSIPNDRSHLLHQQNIRNADHNPIHTYKERYRPPLREYISDSPNQPGLHGSGHRLILNQQSQSNNYQNPVFRNSPSPNIPQDHRNIHPHPQSSESERASPFRQQPSDGVYPPRHSVSNEQQSPQNHLPPVQGGYSNPQVYQDSSYVSNSRNTARGLADVNNQSEEVPDTDSERLSKYKEDYGSSLPTKRRRVRNRKKVQAKEKDDLDGHSSHQYIIKIG